MTIFVLNKIKWMHSRRIVTICSQTEYVWFTVSRTTTWTSLCEEMCKLFMVDLSFNALITLTAYGVVMGVAYHRWLYLSRSSVAPPQSDLSLEPHGPAPKYIYRGSVCGLDFSCQHKLHHFLLRKCWNQWEARSNHKSKLHSLLNNTIICSKFNRYGTMGSG